MTFVPDGVAAAAGQEVVAYGCEDGLAHYVNTSPDAEPRVVNPVWMERNRRCFWSTDKFTGIAFGRGVVAMCGHDRCLRLFDAATGQVLGVVDGSAAEVCVEFSHRGDWVLGGDSWGRITAYYAPDIVLWPIIAMAAAQAGTPPLAPFGGPEPPRASFTVKEKGPAGSTDCTNALVRLGHFDDGREYFLAPSEDGHLRQLAFSRRGGGASTDFRLDAITDFATYDTAFGYRACAAATRDGVCHVAATSGTCWMQVLVYTAALGEPGTLKYTFEFPLTRGTSTMELGFTSVAVHCRESSFDVAAAVRAEKVRVMRFVDEQDAPVASWPIKVARDVALRAVAFSPSGLLATGASDGTLRCYGSFAARRALIACLIRHVAPTPVVTVPEDRTDDLATACRLLLRLLAAAPSGPWTRTGVLAFVGDGEIA